MTVIEHGTWQRYEPVQRPVSAPGNTIFSRRVSDGVDWYDYVHPGTNFRTDTVKMTVFNNIVYAATTNPVAMFAGNGILVLEVTDVPLDDPMRDWSQKIYDPVTKTFSDPPPLTPPEASDFEARLAALEAKVGGK